MTVAASSVRGTQPTSKFRFFRCGARAERSCPSDPTRMSMYFWTVTPGSSAACSERVSWRGLRCWFWLSCGRRGLACVLGEGQRVSEEQQDFLGVVLGDAGVRLSHHLDDIFLHRFLVEGAAGHRG